MSTQKFKPGLLIFSKDRACQLDLLLSSLELFCPEQFDVNILFKASSHDYMEGYKKCSEYHPNDNFIEEGDFRQQTLDVLGKYEYCAVSTDDTVITSPFMLKEPYMKGIDIFSLRLGLNTVVQEPFSGRLQPALSKYDDEGETIIWDSRLYHPHNNNGYQFGMDMVLYSQRYYELVKEIPFKRTNDIEGFLSTNRRDKINPFIRSFRRSVAVNIPANNLSGVTQSDSSIDFEKTNREFLSGYRFRLDEIKQMKVVGCHQVQELVLER